MCKALRSSSESIGIIQWIQVALNGSAMRLNDLFLHEVPSKTNCIGSPELIMHSLHVGPQMSSATLSWRTMAVNLRCFESQEFCLQIPFVQPARPPKQRAQSRTWASHWDMGITWKWKFIYETCKAVNASSCELVRKLAVVRHNLFGKVNHIWEENFFWS